MDLMKKYWEKNQNRLRGFALKPLKTQLDTQAEFVSQGIVKKIKDLKV